LPEEQPVYGLQSPDPGVDAEVFAGIEAMAAHYLRAVREVQSEGPYLLCGWSTGGVVAFEMARQLRAVGETVGLLALLDAHLARSGGRSREIGEAEMILLFARDLAGLSGRDLASLPLEGPEPFARLYEMARAAGLLAADVDLEMARYYYTVFEKNFRAWAAYAGGAFDGEVVLVRPRGNVLASWLGSGGGAEDPLPAWARLAGGRVEVRHVPGDHHTILRGKGARGIAELLARRLATLEPAPVEKS
jgi:thioesterase domain-containing protein